jgi:hypothetical protein
MNEGTKMLDILQVAIPTDTPVTVASEVKILEILGIVSNPQLVASMQLVSAMVPPATPATVKGLIQMLTGLMRMSPKATTTHHQTITSLLTQLNGIPDSALTFGPFLSICQTLIESSRKTPVVHREKHESKAR